MWLTDKKGNFVEIEGFHPSNPYAYENKVVGKYDLAEEGVKLNNYNQQDVLDHINEIKVRIFDVATEMLWLLIWTAIKSGALVMLRYR